MQAYLDQLRYVLENGIQKIDRTGVGTLSCFGLQPLMFFKDGDAVAPALPAFGASPMSGLARESRTRKAGVET